MAISEGWVDSGGEFDMGVQFRSSVGHCACALELDLKCSISATNGPI